MTTSAARLFVLLAREAAIGVILRRGPSRWVQMIKWRTDTDTFEAGQWIKARVYENKCDLSPNGKLFIYFVHKGSSYHADPEFSRHTWTAISKPPYFTALDIQFHIDTYGGGGIFESSKTWSTSVSKYGSLINNHYPSVDRNRRYLDGWQVISEEKQTDSGWIRLKWQKQVKDYSLTYSESHQIRKSQFTNCYSLKRGKLENEISLAGVLWADFDYKGRLVAKDGKLYATSLHGNELKLTELADFNTNKPEPVVAPEWAQKW